MPSDMPDDHGDGDAVRRPDAHGQAALLLVESLVHGLIARDIITVSDAVEIVDVAAEVSADTVGESGEFNDSSNVSLGLLNAISTSLSVDARPG